MPRQERTPQPPLAEPRELPEPDRALDEVDLSTLPLDDDAPGDIVVRPDGFHWISPDSRQEFGPFETLEALRAFRDALDEGAPQPGETLQEAESDIGMADWIDPETGEPAEGQSPPHLEED